MLKTYENEFVEGIRVGDIVRDKGYGRTFVAESAATWVHETASWAVRAEGKWLDVSDYVDITCEEVKEQNYSEFMYA